MKRRKRHMCDNLWDLLPKEIQCHILILSDPNGIGAWIQFCHYNINNAFLYQEKHGKVMTLFFGTNPTHILNNIFETDTIVKVILAYGQKYHLPQNVKEFLTYFRMQYSGKPLRRHLPVSHYHLTHNSTIQTYFTHAAYVPTKHELSLINKISRGRVNGNVNIYTGAL